MDDDDPLESVFSLEDQLYHEGFQEGLADGSRAGRLEGRVFGIKSGFERYVALGRIQGRAALWRARMRKPSQDERGMTDPTTTAKAPREDRRPWSDHARLVKHVQALRSLVAPGNLSFENTEDAISNVDTRLQRAVAKMKVIESITGEPVVVDEPGHVNRIHGDAKDGIDSRRSGPGEPGDNNNNNNNNNIEDIRSWIVGRELR